VYERRLRSFFQLEKEPADLVFPEDDLVHEGEEKSGRIERLVQELAARITMTAERDRVAGLRDYFF
jgi:hypothetical protein